MKYAASALLTVLTSTGPAAAAAGLVVQPDNAALHYGPAPASLPKGTQVCNVLGDPA